MVDFIDLDTEIERSEQRAIPEIFRQKGEMYFRETEARLLREWAAQPRSFVLATGGGAPCFHNGIGIINQHGLSIFIDVPIHMLAGRVRQKTNRPLLNQDSEEAVIEKLTELREKRLSIYRQAHLTVSKPGVKDLVKKIELRM